MRNRLRQQSKSGALVCIMMVFIVLGLTGTSCFRTENTNDDGQKTTSNTLVPDELFKKGVNLYRMHRYLESIQTFQQFLVLYPDHPNIEKAHYYIVKCREDSLEEMGIAVEQFKKQYPKSQYVGQLMMEIGTKFWEKGNYDKAVEYYERVLADFGDYEEFGLGALQKLRDIYLRKNDRDNLIITLERTANIYPDSDSAPRALYSLAILYEQKLRDYVSAYYTYLRIRNVYPEFQTTAIQERIAYFEGDWNSNGIPNYEELQQGKRLGQPPRSESTY